MKFYARCRDKENLLEKVFLRLTFIIFFTFLYLLYFFHEVAPPVTMQPGFVAVFAKFGGNIVLVQFKTRVNKITREIGTKQCSK